nr:MAG TPA: hypothetical protein [Caudoviricetes sp.]
MEKQTLEVVLYLTPEAERAQKAVFDAVSKMTIETERAKNIGFEAALKELRTTKSHILKKFKEMVYFSVEKESKTVSDAILEAAPLFIAAAQSFNA